MQLAEAARATGGRLTGPDVAFTGVGTDSRTLPAGALFVALRGERHDGHDHLAEVAARGAAAVLVQTEAALPLPGLRVADTRHALGELAQAWRGRFTAPLVAVTGSNGKTTVKDMVAAVLATAGPVLATRGNLNNDIGMPLTLFQLGPEHAHVVLELGANHLGELARLAVIARPDVAVITVCAPAHLAGFGSIEGAAMGEGGEVFAGLAEGGTAVINGDDRFAGFWRALAARFRVLGFGRGAGCDIVLEAATPLPDARPGSRVRVRTPRGVAQFTLQLPGAHNVQNALAAVAVGEALGLPLPDVAEALAAVRPPHGRLEFRRGRAGSVVIDDSYNANPGSLRAGLEVLTTGGGQCWLALGDMGELGAEAERLHFEAGETARRLGVERLYAVGALARAAAEGFGAGARHHVDVAALAEDLAAALAPGVRVLVKGSRSMGMERVVERLLAEETAPC